MQMLQTVKISSRLSSGEERRFSRLQIMFWAGALSLALLSSLLLTNAARAQQAYSGQWLIDAKPQAEKVHLQLVRLVDRGVSVSFIEKARAAGHKDLDQMIYLRDNGIKAKRSSSKSRAGMVTGNEARDRF